MKIVKKERDPPLFTSKQLIKFQKILRNTTQVIVRHRICLQTDGQTDGHGETSIPPYNFVAGGIIKVSIEPMSVVSGLWQVVNDLTTLTARPFDRRFDQETQKKMVKKN